MTNTVGEKQNVKEYGKNLGPTCLLAVIQMQGAAFGCSPSPSALYKEAVMLFLISLQARASLPTPWSRRTLNVQLCHKLALSTNWKRSTAVVIIFTQQIDLASHSPLTRPMIGRSGLSSNFISSTKRPQKSNLMQTLVTSTVYFFGLLFRHVRP